MARWSGCPSTSNLDLKSVGQPSTSSCKSTGTAVIAEIRIERRPNPKSQFRGLKEGYPTQLYDVTRPKCLGPGNTQTSKRRCRCRSNHNFKTSALCLPVVSFEFPNTSARTAGNLNSAKTYFLTSRRCTRLGMILITSWQLSLDCVGKSEALQQLSSLKSKWWMDSNG